MIRYFDISDLVRFAKSNGTVSGIQRVQIRVLRHLIHQQKLDEVICIFSLGRYRSIRACYGRDLLGEVGYEAEVLLRKLNIENPHAAFTNRELKNYLSRFPKKSFRRICLKSFIILMSLISPRRARFWMGLPAKQNQKEVSSIKTWCIKTISKDDQIVLIGTNWNINSIDRLARKHYQQGGCVVQVIYDLIPYRYPEYCIESVAKKFTQFLERSRTYVAHYICISESTKRDLENFLHAHDCHIKVSVCPLAHEFEGFGRETAESLPSKDDMLRLTGHRFVLCVGTIEVRKNGVSLLKVWKNFLKNGEKDLPRLVFAGKLGWKNQEFQDTLASDKTLQDHVSIIPQPTDSDLASLYARCLFTVYPSLVEGWGLPVGEAAWFGKYSVVSSSSSLPEVCGDLVDYVSPKNFDGWVEMIKKSISDVGYRKTREKRISETQLRTWKQVSDRFYALLRQ